MWLSSAHVRQLEKPEVSTQQKAHCPAFIVGWRLGGKGAYEKHPQTQLQTFPTQLYLPSPSTSNGFLHKMPRAPAQTDPPITQRRRRFQTSRPILRRHPLRRRKERPGTTLSSDRNYPNSQPETILCPSGLRNLTKSHRDGSADGHRTRRDLQESLPRDRWH